nr:amino acid ABC transporter ATP-binding protein [Halotalea alkalilenta]
MIELDGVRKSFGDTEVLKGISLNVGKGEAVCVIGPSGSGKSTILRTINGLLPVDEGFIRVGEHRVHELRSDREMRPLRRQVAMVFQQYNLFPHRTVLENVAMAPVQVLGHDPEEVRERAVRLLAKVHLDGKESRYPGELSGGQQQRVAIARALAMQPEVILFDEVTAALDPETVKGVLETIRELVVEGMTCVLVTHEMRFAREVSHRVCFTDHGRIVESAPPAELFDAPQDPRTREFLAQVL